MNGYYSRPEARRIAGNKSNSTIWRWENAGLFPRCRKLGPNSIGYLCSEVNEWVKDPEGWAERNAKGVAA